MRSWAVVVPGPSEVGQRRGSCWEVMVEDETSRRRNLAEDLWLCEDQMLSSADRGARQWSVCVPGILLNGIGESPASPHLENKARVSIEAHGSGTGGVARRDPRGEARCSVSASAASSFRACSSTTPRPSHTQSYSTLDDHKSRPGSHAPFPHSSS